MFSMNKEKQEMNTLTLIREIRELSSDYRHTLAGLGAGAISTASLYPLDLVKTHFQIHEKSSKAYQSVFKGITSIYKAGGVRAIYRGMSPAIYGATTSWGLYFYFYERAKAKNAEMMSSYNPSLQHFISGIQAGMLTVPCTNPIWLIKIRMQAQSSISLEKTLSKSNSISIKPYHNVADAFRRIVAEEGVLALYKGIVPALLLTTHGAFKFVAYEKLKGIFYNNVGQDLNAPITLFIGALSQAFGTVMTYPYQVFKSRLQRGGVEAEKYKGVWDCASKIFRHEGVFGFYKGLSANLYKVIPSGAITFAVYEELLSLIPSKHT